MRTTEDDEFEQFLIWWKKGKKKIKIFKRIKIPELTLSERISEYKKISLNDIYLLVEEYVNIIKIKKMEIIKIIQAFFFIIIESLTLEFEININGIGYIYVEKIRKSQIFVIKSIIYKQTKEKNNEEEKIENKINNNLNEEELKQVTDIVLKDSGIIIKNEIDVKTMENLIYYYLSIKNLKRSHIVKIIRLVIIIFKKALKQKINVMIRNIGLFYKEGKDSKFKPSKTLNKYIKKYKVIRDENDPIYSNSYILKRIIKKEFSGCYSRR